MSLFKMKISIINDIVDFIQYDAQRELLAGAHGFHLSVVIIILSWATS